MLFRIASGYPSTDGTNGFRAFRLSLLDDPRVRLDQAWLDRYELEPYLLFQVVRCGFRVHEVPVTVRYHSRGTTKMKILRAGWRPCGGAGAPPGRASSGGGAGDGAPPRRCEEELMTLQNTRVLVTGGAGFVGSNLTRRLIGEGAKVTVLDDLFTGRRENLPDGG